jgi:hypothetical protein
MPVAARRIVVLLAVLRAHKTESCEHIFNDRLHRAKSRLFARMATPWSTLAATAAAVLVVGFVVAAPRCTVSFGFTGVIPTAVVPIVIVGVGEPPATIPRAFPAVVSAVAVTA